MSARPSFQGLIRPTGGPAGHSARWSRLDLAAVEDLALAAQAGFLHDPAGGALADSVKLATSGRPIRTG
jgi:hypothetical protein